MSFFDLVLIGVALGTDAFILALSNFTTFNARLDRKKETAILVSFSFFQFLLSLLGYFFGGLVFKNFKTISSVLPCAVFYFLALKLILDLFKKKDDFKTSPSTLSFLSIILQAISVSVDAFMVGVSFINNLKVNIFYASFIIGVVTLIMVFFALVLGKALKKFLGEYAEFLGIFILLLLGTKSLMALLV